MLQAFIMYTNIDYNIHGTFPLLFISPCRFPFAPLSNPSLLTWNPPCCDRIRPPRSQVTCKLTSPFSTLSPIPPPSKFPESRLPSASLWRPQDSGIFCPEHLLPVTTMLQTMCDINLEQLLTPLSPQPHIILKS